MGMPWATRDGVSQAIPPAYTECIGRAAHGRGRVTVFATRAVVCTVTIEAPTMEACDLAFAELASRVHWSLPKLRFGDVRIKAKRVTIHSLTPAGRVEKASSYTVPRP